MLLFNKLNLLGDNLDLEQLQQSTKDLKVLYVEDSMMMRKVTQKILLNYFDHIDTACDGAEAFELYTSYYDKHEKPYDILITDLEMPVMDGAELSRKVLDYNYTQDIIVISSVGEFDRLVDLMNLGVNKFISKPIEEVQLSEVIDQVYQNIYLKRLQAQESLEVVEYNRVLKEKEDAQQVIIQKKAKELEEFNQALTDSAIVSKTDIHGVMTYVNEQMINISGYTSDELVGKNSSFLGSGKRPKSFFTKLWNTINDKNIYKILFQNKTKDGNMFYLETTINPIIDVDGNIVEFIAVSHDMTQLINSLEEVKKSKKEKEDFFINISHEMKTPLNSILGFSAMLQKRLADDEKSMLMVNTINETGQDLNKLVESIIDMRKIQDHTLELKEMAFSPRDELTKCINGFVENAYKKNQKFESLLDDSLPKSLFGDPSRICQVLGAIVDNAIKFTPDEGRIAVRVTYDDILEVLLLGIKDNGIGIAKEDKEKIFGLEQLDATANRAHEGAGLGLNIAYNLVEVMGGKISVNSIPTKGSLFEVELPLKSNI